MDNKIRVAEIEKERERESYGETHRGKSERLDSQHNCEDRQWNKRRDRENR